MGAAARRLGWLVAAAALGLAGCAAVPRSSDPQVVGPVAAGPPTAAPTISPQPGADPRGIVTGFLNANASEDRNHAAARLFLTPDARNRWSDTTVTILDTTQVSVFDPARSSITVTGRRIGTIDSSGIYSPALTGDGRGGDRATFEFGITVAGGEWRIDQLKDGLVLSLAQFGSFQQRPIYFFDLAERHLVPDPRYTPLPDSNQAGLATWLIGQVAAGARPELQSAVRTELPAQTDPRSVTVTVGDVVTITLPGAAQLDPTTRNRLAEQLAQTLQAVTGSEPIQIVDAGKPLQIPAVAGTQFSSADFANTVAPSVPPLYYIRKGKVLTATGAPVPGPLGAGTYALTSVALAPDGIKDTRVAGTSGTDPVRLLTGTRLTGLRPTAVQGQLSRPTWAPDLDEVWIGNGQSILRVNDGRVTGVPVTTTTGKLVGQVIALRFSPEGSRIAVVLAAPEGTVQLWIGSVIRSSGQVQVDNLEAITPIGVLLTDVAWNDELKLFVTGRYTTGEASVFEVQVDGSLWTPRAITGLPEAPDSITVAANVPAWVSAGGTVWTQRGSSWISPSAAANETDGTKPVYLE
jgi:Lipoprotein LpqB beta-propeller domain/Sporulation and spore germination